MSFPVCNIQGLEFTFSPAGKTKTNVYVRHVLSDLPVMSFIGSKAPHKICKIINAVLASFPHFNWSLPADKIILRREDMAEIATTLEEELRQSGVRDRPRY